MGVFICLFLPTIIILLMLWLCRWYNFSIIPRDMKPPPPSKFKIPLLSKEKKYFQWEEEKKEKKRRNTEEEYESYEEELIIPGISGRLYS